MSVYGLLRTGASGMAAQGNRLGAVADNIANVNTAGYKAASTEFSTLVLNNNTGQYVSGGVQTDVRHSISQQGNLQFSTSTTDLAITGNGFFVVETGAESTGLTRAGSFLPDGNGELVNAAGYRLLGYPIQPGGDTVVANGTAGLERISIAAQALVATPSVEGRMQVNLPASAPDIGAGSRPSDNVIGADYSAKSSLLAYDSLGNEVVIDVYFTKTATGQWDVTVFDNAQADAATVFPYASGPLATETLNFDPLAGTLPAGGASISFTVPGGVPFTLDFAGTTQLAADYTVLSVDVDGNGPSEIADLSFTNDGFVYAVYENGSQQAIYRVPLASVVSADQLRPAPGNVFLVTAESGDLLIGLPGEGGLGSITSGALEGSTVDLADELTTMIEAQRNYTANSKVFQTGADLLDVLVNLKR